MTDYRTIRGKKIKTFTTDLSDGVSAEGQVFYSNTDKKYKIAVAGAAWHSAPSYPSVLFRAAAFGITTAAVVASGSSTSTNRLSSSNEYNGTGFSVGGDLNSARRLLSASGTQTAGLVFGGALAPSDSAVSDNTETYDGSSYSEVGDLNTARQGSAGDGTQTASFMAGGSTAPGHNAASESWDGTSWTNIPSINTSRRFLAGGGTVTASVVCGGETTPTGTPAGLRKQTEEYDGSSWSEVNDLNTGMATHGTGGTQTALIAFAGRSPSTSVKTELYDGTSWTATTDMASARSMVSGTGTQTAAITAGGETQPGPLTANTEEFNITAATITGGAWSSGGSLNSGRRDLGGFGTKTAAAAISGDADPGYSGIWLMLDMVMRDVDYKLQD
jgi:hypothetical protein